jgi:hypothetical protein
MDRNCSDSYPFVAEAGMTDGQPVVGCAGASSDDGMHAKVDHPLDGDEYEVEEEGPHETGVMGETVDGLLFPLGPSFVAVLSVVESLPIESLAFDRKASDLIVVMLSTVNRCPMGPTSAASESTHSDF